MSRLEKAQEAQPALVDEVTYKACGNRYVTEYTTLLTSQIGFHVVSSIIFYFGTVASSNEASSSELIMDLERLRADLDGIKSQPGPQLDEVSPLSGLTERDRLLIERSWREVMQLGAVKVGIELFELFFSRHPEYIQLFRALREVPPDKLRSNPRFKAHGTIVVQSISGIIENLEDGETMVHVLQKIGRDHVRRNLTPKHFENLKLTILLLLESVLGEAWSGEVAGSWQKALGAVMSTVEGAMKGQETLQDVKLAFGQTEA